MRSISQYRVSPAKAATTRTIADTRGGGVGVGAAVLLAELERR